jgi:hypothetical protein
MMMMMTMMNDGGGDGDLVSLVRSEVYLQVHSSGSKVQLASTVLCTVAVVVCFFLKPNGRRLSSIPSSVSFPVGVGVGRSIDVVELFLTTFCLHRLHCHRVFRLR